jgi:hypothetical protein
MRPLNFNAVLMIAFSRAIKSTKREIGNEWDRQPQNFNQGLNRGMRSLTREFSSVADSLIAVPLTEYKKNGTGGSRYCFT